MSTTIYTNNKGCEIAVGDGLLTASNSTGPMFSLPIAPDELAALGAALIERANAAKHGRNSERAGYALGRDLVREIAALRGRLPEDSLCAAHDKLHALSKLEEADFAAGGFASAIIDVLEAGIASLPQFEGVPA